jgi:hypothetical protein
MDRLAGMEVFLVAYTPFNLNLEIFAETGKQATAAML